VSRRRRVEHEFVEFIPQELAPGTVYISGPYATCSHLCLCGCGEKVVTPLAPTEWKLKFDGETITLWPSIGNWSFGCQSHYWIEESRVIWAHPWSKKRIQANRKRDRQQKQRRRGRSLYEPGDQERATGRAPGELGWLRRVWPRRQ
jgi:hypothetical protein